MAFSGETIRSAMDERLRCYFERAKKEDTTFFPVMFVLVLKHAPDYEYYHFNYKEINDDKIIKEMEESNWMRIESDGIVIPMSFSCSRFSRKQRKGELFISFSEIAEIAYVRP